MSLQNIIILDIFFYCKQLKKSFLEKNLTGVNQRNILEKMFIPKLVHQVNSTRYVFKSKIQ